MDWSNIITLVFGAFSSSMGFFILLSALFELAILFVPIVAIIEAILFIIRGWSTENRFYMNPSNNHIEEVSSFDCLWILLFAPLYFILKGVWRHFLLWVILSPTLVSWVIYPLFAKSIIHNNYLRMNWKKATRYGATPTTPTLLDRIK